MKTLGIALLIIGLVVTLYAGFGFVTKEKVVDVGSVEITKDEKHTANWSPFVGIGIMVVGAVILLAGRRKAI